MFSAVYSIDVLLTFSVHLYCESLLAVVYIYMFVTERCSVFFFVCFFILNKTYIIAC